MFTPLWSLVLGLVFFLLGCLFGVLRALASHIETDSGFILSAAFMGLAAFFLARAVDEWKE